MATAAYIRVSTPEQDPERQYQDIKSKFDVSRDHLYADVEHGDVFTGRDCYDALMDSLEDYEKVVFEELTRLGRSAREMRDTAHTLREAGVTIATVSPLREFPPDEDDAMSKLFFDILTRMAEAELERIRSRTKSGIRQAKREGKHVGNPPREYTVEDGFLEPIEGEYERISKFIREVNKGRAKAPTARFFGVDETSYQSILENSDRYWDAEYVGDEEWRRRRVEVQNGEKDLEPLGEVET